MFHRTTKPTRGIVEIQVTTITLAVSTSYLPVEGIGKCRNGLTRKTAAKHHQARQCSEKARGAIE
jgi:hypothetical protein